MDNRTYRDESESIKRVLQTMKAIILDKVESIHLYKNIRGRHIIEGTKICGGWFFEKITGGGFKICSESLRKIYLGFEKIIYVGF